MSNTQTIPHEVRVRQWFHAGITEQEGQSLVGHIAGTKKYGLLVPYNDLPEQAKAIVRSEFNARQETPCESQEK